MGDEWARFACNKRALVPKKHVQLKVRSSKIVFIYVYSIFVILCVCVCECMVMRVLYRKYRIYLRERETY